MAQKPKAPAGPRRYLVLADPVKIPSSPDGKALPALSGTRKEAQNIVAIAPKGAVTILTGSQATKSSLLAAISDAPVVHIATHGVIRDDAPFDTFLALSNDGRLTAREIYDLKLNSHLVVLSACRSGLGKVMGKGTLGLTRAFFYAGVPSVITSLWDVADEPAARLLAEFYRSYSAKGEPMNSLRDAQLRMLELLRNGKVQMDTPGGPVTLPEHPILWAGYTLRANRSVISCVWRRDGSRCATVAVVQRWQAWPAPFLPTDWYAATEFFARGDDVCSHPASAAITVHASIVPPPCCTNSS